MEMLNFAWIYSPEAWISLATLIGLEIVLGIDNIIFIAILCDRLPVGQRDKARIIGLGLAMITRILLLLSLFWIMKLTSPLFSVGDMEISGRDLILILGGLFLLVKSTTEISHSVTGADDTHDEKNSKTFANFGAVLVQIAILDIVFSLDSVITAVGMADHVMVMIIAVIVAVGFMMVASGSISRFVNNNPTIKILALSFLIVVGVALIADGLDFHIPKGYIYFSMAFSLSVEMINITIRNKKKKALEK